MNNDSGHTLWSDVPEGMGQPEDDFASFLELGDFDSLDLSAFAVVPNGVPNSAGSSGGGGPINATSETFSNDVTKASMDRRQMQLQQDAVMGFAQVHLRQQYQNGTYHGHGGYIPPTPSSLEMQAGTQGYTDHTPYMDCYQAIKDDQMVFTPLVSPAVTPYDSSFIHVPEFTMPGAYFSPLNSPALEAQGRNRVFRNSTSPIEPKETVATKKSRRKSGSLRNPARVVRESPSMKPQRGRKAPPPLLATPELVGAAISMSPNTQARKGNYGHMPGISLPSSRENSSTDSISPEPLSEALMPPPPAPSNKTTRSPYLAPINGKMDIDEVATMNDKSNVAPATPASLMNLSKPTPTIPEERTMPGFLTNDQIVRNFAINNESGADASSPIMIDTENVSVRADDEQSTPTMSSIRHMSSTKQANTNSKSRSTSTDVAPKPSPNAVAHKASSGSLNKKHSRAASAHIKRGSVSMSPALQPRISPSIKPLLPEGMSSSASALMLASKSNYENIVAGNHNQLGLSYPAHISTNLTSKRTSHKIAEQGRRNRINNGLTVLQSLLPPKSGNTSEGGSNNGAPNTGASTGGGSGGDQANSKALTVEMAIDYIKELQTQLGDMKSRVGGLEEELRGHKEKQQEVLQEIPKTEEVEL